MQSLLSYCNWQILLFGCLPVKFPKQIWVSSAARGHSDSGTDTLNHSDSFLVIFLFPLLLLYKQQCRRLHAELVKRVISHSDARRTMSLSGQKCSLFLSILFLIFYILCWIYFFLRTCLQLKSGQINTYYCTEGLKLDVSQWAADFLFLYMGRQKELAYFKLSYLYLRETNVSKFCD